MAVEIGELLRPAVRGETGEGVEAVVELQVGFGKAADLLGVSRGAVDSAQLEAILGRNVVQALRGRDMEELIANRTITWSSSSRRTTRRRREEAAFALLALNLVAFAGSHVGRPTRAAVVLSAGEPSRIRFVRWLGGLLDRELESRP